MSQRPSIVTVGGKEIKVIYLKRLGTPYPLEYHNIVDTPEGERLWKPFLAECALSDPRGRKAAKAEAEGEVKGKGGAESKEKAKHYELAVMDESRLQYKVKEGESIIFRDMDTGRVVAGAIQGVMDEEGDEEVLKVLTGSVVEFINNTKSTIRNDDPGYMASAGYTSGSRHDRNLQWAKNLRPGVDAEVQAVKVASIFAHIYGKIEPFLPDDVYKDCSDARTKLGGLEMDAGCRSLEYTMNLGGKDVTFKTSKFAPASGLCALNYGRFTHNESNASEYCFGFILSRNHAEHTGANFFVAQYGISIPNRANQLNIWKGKDFHGTTLLLADPSDTQPPERTINVAFILSKGLKAEIKRKENAGSSGSSSRNSEVGKVHLGDGNVESRPRPIMVMRTVRKDREHKKHVKDKKFIAHLPEAHPYMYERSGKSWSKEKLLEECERRTKVDAVGFGHYAYSWTIPFLIRKLLEHDGILVEVGEVEEEVDWVMGGTRDVAVDEDVEDDEGNEDYELGEEEGGDNDDEQWRIR